MFPSECGKVEVVLAEPSLAVVNIALLAGKVPVFVTVKLARTVELLVRLSVDVTNRVTLPHGVVQTGNDVVMLRLQPPLKLPASGLN